jgi:hypothetical protein
MAMEADSTIAVNAQVTAGDLNELWKWSRFKYLAWPPLVLFGLLYAYFAFATIANEGLTSENFLNVTLYSSIAAMALLGMLLISPARSRLMMRYGPTLRETRRYTFSEKGVRFDSDLMRCDCRWDAFFAILESRKSFLLYQSPLSGMAIPKRYFSSAHEIDHLRSLFRNHFKGKLRLRS